MRSKRSVEARFTAAAGTYDHHAKVQRAIADQLVLLGAALTPPDSVLEIGCGTGSLTKLIHAAFPDAEIHALDLSAKMLHKARADLESDLVTFIQADIDRFISVARYPVIFSSSALHWSRDLETSTWNIYEALEQGGTLMLALMLSGTLRELHEARGSVAPDRIPDAQLPDFESVRQALASAGFDIIAEKAEQFSITYPSGREFLEALHDQGLTGGAVSHGHRLLTRSQLETLTAKYDVQYAQPDGGVAATYEVGYFRAVRR